MAGLLLAAAIAGGASPARAAEVVRISVATGVAQVELSGPGLAAESLRDGGEHRPVPGGRARVRLEGDALLLDGKPVEGAGVAFTADGSIRTLGRSLSGEVEVRRGPGGLSVIDVLPLEEYVAAVVGAEMPPRFPPEALKAQAVAARTFALVRKLDAREQGLDFDMGATVLDQVYPGAGGADPRARAAAEATAGEVLVKDRRPVETYFHSTCGGRTEKGADALGRDQPYLVSVPCDRCQASPSWRWTVRIPASELGRAAGVGEPATRVSVVRTTSTGRAARVSIEGPGGKVVLDGADLRRRLGYERLPSLAFTVRLAKGTATFEGRGSGHGAGMCQWGAAGRARAGDGYAAILSRYYPGTQLARLY
ncbi:MAG TPA: SpoIID/LytB domain-containing protein [Anaeromyxobacteraceae bacterium]|nr:SpoIID/LytB domain-containing protein [Anaeromyxobacteraceae bacterium]